MNRRRLLRTVAVGTAVVGGCLGRSDRSNRPPDVRPEPDGTDPEPSNGRLPDEECEGGERIDVDGPVSYGGNEYFDLVVCDDEPRVGDPLRVELYNATERSRSTGVESKSLIERRVDGEWRSIHFAPAGERYFRRSDAIAAHEPGEGFTWTFHVSPVGLSYSFEYGQRMIVCSPVTAGEYRFVNFGTDHDRPRSLAARFTLQ